jgi:membrane-bound metal-dependent hydrolase YbcI (DUF457 family)
MFLGHYGLALAAKRASPRTSLGTLVFGAQFLDELWPILLLAGVERVRIVPGFMSASSLEFTWYPWSHSLLMTAVWAMCIGAAYRMWVRNPRGAWLMAALVLSHWLLDAPMHPPDLPLWPGSSILVGAGLWSSKRVTIVIDAGIFLIGLLVYVRTTRSRDAIGRWALSAMSALLLFVFLSSLFDPPPSSERTLAWSALLLWLFVPWSWWIDVHRDVVVRPGRPMPRKTLPRT